MATTKRKRKPDTRDRTKAGIAAAKAAKAALSS